jgi:hypothetical protein
LERDLRTASLTVGPKQIYLLNLPARDEDPALLVLDFEMAVVEWRRLQQRARKATLEKMIKETIPELETLSPAEKFALAIELWDELASNPDEILVTDEQLKNWIGVSRSINAIQKRS